MAEWFMAVVLRWIYATIRPEAAVDRRRQAFVLTYSERQKLVAWLMLFSCPLFTVALVVLAVSLGEPIEPRDLPIIAGGLLASVPVGLPFLLEFYKNRVWLLEEGIELRSAWRSRREKIRWEDVTEVSFDRTWYWFNIRGNGRLIRVNLMLDGLGSFVEVVQRRLPVQTWANAQVGFDQVERLHRGAFMLMGIEVGRRVDQPAKA